MNALRIGRNASIGFAAAVVGLCLVLVSMCTPAMAVNATGWEVSSRAVPTNLAPGASGSVDVAVQEIGAEESRVGARVVDTLPVGIEGVAENGWVCNGEAPDAAP